MNEWQCFCIARAGESCADLPQADVMIWCDGAAAIIGRSGVAVRP